MRNVLAVLLAAIAAICGASAWGGYTIDKALTQPETVQESFGPLVDNAGVRDMVATWIHGETVALLPGGVVPAKLDAAVKVVIDKATNAVLDDPASKQAWEESLQETREQYAQQVHSGGSATHIQMVLDPFANLASSKIVSTLQAAGINASASQDRTWRLEYELGDVSPLVSTTVPAVQLVVSQSQYWARYAIAAAVAGVLGLVIAKRRGVPIIASAFVLGAAGLIGWFSASMVGSVTRGAGNALVVAVADPVAALVRSTSMPLVFVAVGLLVVGIIVSIIGSSVRKRRASDWEW